MARVGAKQIKSIWFGLLALVIGTGHAAQSSAREAVDVQIVFATDISGSIGADAYRAQRDGVIAALESPEVRERLISGRLKRAGLSYFDWSGQGEQYERVPWTVVRAETAEADIRGFIQALRAATAHMEQLDPTMQDMGGGGSNTSISGALHFARTRILPASPFDAARTVIDVSGDGINNEGHSPHFERDQLTLDPAVTINGIVVTGQEQGVVEHYEENVIGGLGAFVLRSNGLEDYARAMRRKLLSEIAWAIWGHDDA